MGKRIASVKVISNVKEAIKLKDTAVERALIRIGEVVSSAAQEELSRPKMHADGSVRPNVDTGRLRNSIIYATNTKQSYGKAPAESTDYKLNGVVEEGKVVVGTNVEYAPYVEMGTSKSAPYPYLKPAVQNSTNVIKEIIEEELKS